jgi:membrane protease YdiL (CAAX protease family)
MAKTVPDVKASPGAKPRAQKRLSYEALTLPLPFVFWYFVFDYNSILGGFWPAMTAATLILLSFSLLRFSSMKLKITSRGFLIGVGSALFLYALFWDGYQVVKFLPGLSSFSPILTQQVAWVYQLRGTMPLGFIAAALLFPIGPAEELYWRGFIQGHFNRTLNPRKSLLLTTILYTSIHLVTLNPSLIAVAFIGGLFWGYIFNRTGDVFPALVSHIVFDELIFVILVIA